MAVMKLCQHPGTPKIREIPMHAHPRAALAMAAALASFITLSTVAKPAQAAFQISNVGLQCSESLVVQEGDAYVLSCTGDLSLQGLGGQGSFQADTSITLNATGSLSLIDVLLQAPNIALNGATVSLNAGTTLTPMPGGVNDPRLTDPRLTDPGAASGSGGVVLVNGSDLGSAGGAQGPSGGRTEGGTIVIGGGSLGSNDPKFGDVTLPTVGSAVPEASGWATMAAGLIALMGLMRRPRH